jgi:hypothetical protein
MDWMHARRRATDAASILSSSSSTDRAADVMRRNAPRLTSMRKLSHTTYKVNVRELPPVSVETAGHTERIWYGTYRSKHPFDHVTTYGMMICFHDY